MTREEIITLLKYVRNAYPNQKIENGKGIVDIWEMAFGSEDARIVYRAARLHIEKSPFFPAPSNVKELMSRAEMILGIEAEKSNAKIEAPKTMLTYTDRCPLNSHYCILYGDLCSGPDENGKCEFDGL